VRERGKDYRLEGKRSIFKNIYEIMRIK